MRKWVCSYCYKTYGKDKCEKFDDEQACKDHCDANHGCRANARPIRKNGFDENNESSKMVIEGQESKIVERVYQCDLCEDRVCLLRISDKWETDRFTNENKPKCCPLTPNDKLHGWHECNP